MSTSEPIISDYFSSALLTGVSTSTNLSTVYPANQTLGDAQAALVGGNVNIVSANTIQLSSGASNQDEYYTGDIIRVTRISVDEDDELVQEAEIVSYNGANRIATIDGIWITGQEPSPGDIVDILPKYADSRVSINPVMQTLDYITSTTYGKGLDVYKDMNLPSWQDSGRQCDAQSDVTVLSLSAAGVHPGDIYRYPANGPLQWQGTVLGSDTNNYIEFSNVLGKLTNKWNNWKTFVTGQLVYDSNRLYSVVADGVITAEPFHTSGTSQNLAYVSNLSITKISGSGPATINLFTAGNPVRAEDATGSVISGYSLYDSDGVDYFRLLGWDEPTQRYVTRHQTNLIVDTSQPLFDNINSFLNHFGGILRYSGNQYYMEVEEPQGPISNDDDEIRNVTTDHIIGKIKLSDDGVKNSVNSLTAAYSDPGNKYETRNISFFNSIYLKEDRNVPKKGNLSVPGITNYYNTRILADKYLNKSRFGLTISFNMTPRGLSLLAGKVIQIQYPRYGWEDKKFRISNLTHNDDATVDIVAKEYDDSFYVLSNIAKQAAAGLTGNSAETGIGPPSDLIATSVDGGDEVNSGVGISWKNNPDANTQNCYTELYSSYSSHLYVTVNTISGNVLTTTVAHQLKEGELITSQVSAFGLDSGKSYYIKSIVSDTQFTISETKAGDILGLTDAVNAGVPMLTANLIATIPIPGNNYTDVFGGIDGRVIKYYWVRHKVVRGN